MTTFPAKSDQHHLQKAIATLTACLIWLLMIWEFLKDSKKKMCKTYIDGYIDLFGNSETVKKSVNTAHTFY